MWRARALGINEKDAQLLIPLDGSGDKETGEFKCGRYITKYEAKEVQLPEMSCDACVLQITWKTENGDIYQCADLTIDDDQGGEGRAYVSGEVRGAVPVHAHALISALPRALRH